MIFTSFLHYLSLYDKLREKDRINAYKRTYFELVEVVKTKLIEVLKKAG